jgi:hypothetical protein
MPLKFRLASAALVLLFIPAACLPASPTASQTAVLTPDQSNTRLASPSPLLPSISLTIPSACQPSAQASDWSASVSASCLVSPSRANLLQVLFTVWLAHFLSDSVPAQYRLLTFTIISIDNVGAIANLPNTDFGAVITYSVKPAIDLNANPTSAWAAGDGIPGSDNWVRQKRADAWVARNADSYLLYIAPHGAT